MTLHWTLYNLGSEYFEASLSPSVADFLFSFNLAVRTPDEGQWIVASKEYVPGREAGILKIQGRKGQHLYLLIKDDKGVEKRLLYEMNHDWPAGGALTTANELPNYHQYFVESQGINENDMYCKALFAEYKELEEKTNIVTQTYKPGAALHVNSAPNPQDLMRKKVIAKEIVNKCQSYFADKPAEFSEIEESALD